MNTLHLKYVIEIEKAGSITKAADNLFMGQPNLSKAVRELEENLGITIFKRTSKGVIPTEKGEKLIKYARSILAQVDELEALYTGDSSEKIKFNICIPRSSYIARAFTEFARKLDRRKEMEISSHETNAIQGIDCVADGDCNISVIRYQANYENYFLDYLYDRNIIFDPIWVYDYVLLVPARSPLANREEITSCDLHKYLEIAHGDDNIPYVNQSKQKDCSKEQTTNRKIYVYDRFTQFEILNNQIDSYMWASPVPADLLERYNLVQKHCVDINLKFKDVLIYEKNYNFSELDKQFLGELFTGKQELEKSIIF